MTAIAGAAARLGTTPRMLRYRESLGLVRPERTASGYRQFSDDDVVAAALAARLEAEYGVPPAAVAFALRALEDAEVASRLRLLARLARRPSSGAAATPVAALDFEKQKATRLLKLDLAA